MTGQDRLVSMLSSVDITATQYIRLLHNINTVLSSHSFDKVSSFE